MGQQQDMHAGIPNASVTSARLHARVYQAIRYTTRHVSLLVDCSLISLLSLLSILSLTL